MSFFDRFVRVGWQMVRLNILAVLISSRRRVPTLYLLAHILGQVRTVSLHLIRQVQWNVASCKICVVILVMQQILIRADIAQISPHFCLIFASRCRPNPLNIQLLLDIWTQLGFICLWGALDVWLDFRGWSCYASQATLSLGCYRICGSRLA